MSTIAVLGTLDTKGAEHAYVADLIRQRGHQTLLIDVGTLGNPSIQPDIPRGDAPPRPAPTPPAWPPVAIAGRPSRPCPWAPR